jgi:formylglycine-generating enzyme required for sulfatase activity
MVRNRIRFVRIAGICLAAAAVAVAQAVSSQRVQPAGNNDMLAEFTRGPHVGSADEAIVAIEVTNTSKDGAVQQVRRGSGVVLRCDGFVLAPSALFDASMMVAGAEEDAGKQAVAVILNAGTATEKRVVGRRPRFVPRDLGYAVLKLDRIHTPAVRTLLPSACKQGDGLTVVATRWDDATKRYLAPLRLTAHQGVELPEESRPGRVSFGQALVNVPAGALVVGPDGLAVGLIASGTTQAKCESYVGFGVLDRATNCVTPFTRAPSAAPQAAHAGGQEAGAEKAHEAPMAFVPGGPVELPRGVQQEQPDMEGATLACVAPFEIDKFEVTNREYLEFWNTIPLTEQRRLSVINRMYPLTWSKAGAPFPSELADAPVMGVALPGAQAYAAYRGKRLPTPYEWCLAAFGPQGEKALPEWAQRYIRERRETWSKVREMHLAYLQQHPEIYNNGLIYKLTRIPWIAASPVGMEASNWSRQTVEQQTRSLWTMYKDPLYVVPVGSRDFDQSLFGVFDVLLNANEMVAPYPGPPTLGNARYMEVFWNKLPIRPPDEWLPRFPELVTSDERDLPPISRLYRRNLVGPSMEDVLAWSGINEAAQMLAPLSGLQVRMSGAATSTAVGKPRSVDAYAQLRRPPGMTLWEGTPRHFRVEMGMPIPVDRAETRAGPAAHLFYYYPNGFRCAR